MGVKMPLHNLPRRICGVAAGVSSLFFLYQGRGEFPVVFASLFLFAICITDTLYSKIPNLFNAMLALSGFGYNLWLSGPAGLLTSFWGLLAGFSLLLIPYLMGGMGAGDVKALAALGTLIGAGPIFQVFLYMALAGGVMAVLHYAFNQNLYKKCRQFLSSIKLFCYTRDWQVVKPAAKSENLRFPYAAAITFGFFANAGWGSLI